MVVEEDQKEIRGRRSTVEVTVSLALPAMPMEAGED
jgi:hypothetical protein